MIEGLIVPPVDHVSVFRLSVPNYKEKNMLVLDSLHNRLIISHCRNLVLISLLSSQCISIPAALAAEATVNQSLSPVTTEKTNQPAGNTLTKEDIHTLLLKPGQPLVAGMNTEDIVATYNVPLAKEQVAAYPDSPEASFVLAVALTRTSMVEEALKEVRRARKLAEKHGGPAYFDHMISEYETMLKSYPKDNQVRYGLAWAYYMKAYVLTHYAKAIVNNKTANASSPGNKQTSARPNWQSTWVKSLSQPVNQSATAQSLPMTKETPTTKSEDLTADQIINPINNLPPELAPQVKAYYQAALNNLDQLLIQEPGDMWARAYRAFLSAEYTGDLQQAMNSWRTCLNLAPTNPAAYFFLGQGYLRQGNLKECLHNISKAVALRSLATQ